MISFAAFSDELEKIAIGDSGADEFKRQVAEAKKEKGRTIAHEIPGPAGSKRYRFQRHEMKDVPFLEDMKRNAVATGRRLANPKKLLSRVKWSVTNPAAPKWSRALSAAGIVGTGASVMGAGDDSKSRLNKALSGAGGLIGGAAGRGLTGGLIGGAVGSGIGGLAGDALDKLRGYKPKVKKQAEVAE